MTVMMSCDHHDENRCVPDNRSRKRMLEQLRAAVALGDALGKLAPGAKVNLKVNPDGPGFAPTIELDLARFLQLWTAYRDWRDVQPRGEDDWVPPFPPSEIRVPDLDGLGPPVGEIATD